LNLFNFAAVKISNLSKYLPDCRQMRFKFSTAYGCRFIFHPVREAVGLRVNGTVPFFGDGELIAPLYGGPGMIASGATQILAHYEKFTKNTVFLVDEALAHETLIGKAAAIRAKLGGGSLYLFGPHLEHPHYPEANKLIADAIFWDAGRSSNDDAVNRIKSENLSESDSRNLIGDLKRELSNSRVVAASLELLPIRWLIGAKYYEPEKLRVFLESMWRRLLIMEKHGRLCLCPSSTTNLVEWATEITHLLRLMKNELDRDRDTVAIAGRVFTLIQKFTATFLQMYFLTVSEPI
jgi:hypothetical protein